LYSKSNSTYQIHLNAITHSKLINTKQIAQLLQNPDQQKQALELELKKMEEEVNKSFTSEQKELVSGFIQNQKKLIENKKDKKARSEVKKVEKQLEKEGFADEEMEKIIKYCKKVVNLVHQLEEQEKLQTQIEVSNNTNTMNN